MTAPRTLSMLKGSGSSPASPRLDGFEGWPEAPGRWVALEPGPWLCKAIRVEKPGGDGSARLLLSITTDLL